MYRLSALMRRLTAVTFLVTYLGLFAGQAFCTGTADPFAETGRAACCMGKACAGMGYMATKGKNSKSPDCSKRGIARLLASQASPQGHSFLLAPPALLPETAISVPFLRFTRWSPAQKVALVPARHLPPKIPDIRIYIQSLTV